MPRNPNQSFWAYQRDYMADRMLGRTTFRRDGWTGIKRILGLVLYPVAVVQALLSLPVVLGLGTLFDPLMEYFDIVTAVLSWLLVLLAVGIGILAYLN